jgi:GNAT superfamily N-acetyltransferase
VARALFTLAGVPTLRPMERFDDIPVHELAAVTFAELAARFHEPPSPPPPMMPALVRINQLLERDPGGAWVAEEDGRLVGAALALDREGVWGLSLLVVLPEHQSSGVGRALLRQSLEYANGGERGGIILASADERALRVYSRAGFAMHPSVTARGRPTVSAAPREVREGDEDDLPLTEAVDRAVRGAAHGSDIAALLRAHCRLLVHPDRGYAVVGGGAVRLVAALDEEAARDLLLAGLAAMPPREEISVEWITAAQAWAVGPVLDAGLRLRPAGAVFLRGDVGPFRPYLPNGAYL